MSTSTASGAPQNTTATAVQKMTQYRWIVLAILFVLYTINFGDRANIGVVLPVLKTEFNLTNLELGALSSFFFLGYATTQIPAGFWYGRYGCRTLVPLSALGFSLVTWFMGTASSAAHLKWLRLALGVAEGPGPVGMATTLKTWFPKKEQSFATAFYSASVMFAPVIVPPIAVWIMINYGWRYVFFSFAIPGVIMAIVWYLFVHNNPKESPYCNAQEEEYIRSAVPAPAVPTTAAPGVRATRDFGWLDWVIRAKKCPTLDTNKKVFCSRNIWVVTFAYFMMTQVFIGLLTWVPSYLVNAKGFPMMTMGFVAASPWIGGVIGAITGGWISDNILMGRRKPNMMFAALTVAIICWLSFTCRLP
jgi:MFS transporter, ACS family, glucarate transporter